MKKITGTLAAAALLGLMIPRVHGLELISKDKLQLDVHARGQMIGVGENLPDPIRDNNRLFLFLKQARLGFRGSYGDVLFDAQLAFGGENANGSNTDLGLLDFVADIPVRPLGEFTSLKVGQFRVPYSREGLTDTGYMNFGARSIANMASFQGRDYGLALQRHQGAFAATIGIFSAAGRDVPQRYLPERLGAPEVVLRVGYNDGVDKDVYHVVGTDRDLKRTTKAVYLNALYMQDSLVGHSSVLNVRTIDKNLLVNGNYNQFVKAGPNGVNGSAATLQRGNIWFVGGDAVIRHRISAKSSLEGEAEINWGGYQNRYGVLHIAAARVQGSYRFDPYQVGVRYAVLALDKNAKFRDGSTTYNSEMGKPIHEITPSATWHIKGHNLKIVADAPILLNVPLFYEQGVGAYVFANQPDQVSVIKTAGNNTARKFVFQARMMFQFMF